VRPATPAAEAEVLAACFRAFDPIAPGSPGDAIVDSPWHLVGCIDKTGFFAAPHADPTAAAASDSTSASTSNTYQLRIAPLNKRLLVSHIISYRLNNKAR